MTIEQILKNLDALKRALGIFKTEWSADQRIQISIFEMMKAKQPIDHRAVRRWSKHHHQSEPNPTRCEEVCKLWMKEIDKHNRNLFKDQKKLF